MVASPHGCLSCTSAVHHDIDRKCGAGSVTVNVNVNNLCNCDVTSSTRRFTSEIVATVVPGPHPGSSARLMHVACMTRMQLTTATVSRNQAGCIAKGHTGRWLTES